MYRIFILSLLAIVSATFALEPSQVILRATDIRGDSMLLEWSPLAGAKTYKVFYDEESLINPKAPEPILETPATDVTKIEIQKMMEGTEYYLIVHGFDDTGTKVGSSIPLHASTIRTPLFALKSAETVDDQNIALTFSQPIDIKNTEIEVVNTETKKARSIKKITVSEDDLRVVQVLLEGKMAPDVSHDIVLKKVTNTTGITMSPEARKTMTVAYESVSPTSSAQTVQDAPVKEEKQDAEIQKDPETSAIKPDVALESLQKESEELGIEKADPVVLPIESEVIEKKPVEIDSLPKTGSPLFFLLTLAIIIGAWLSYKKKTSF